MSNDNTTNSFEELTFPSLLKKYDKILIPMIQRDYAQGRSDEKAQEVRTNLLKDIFEKESVHFDLIFGSCEKRKENNGEKHCFIPIDGQQRLTTLFLLHLYAQNLGRNDEDLDLSKFSYDTRRAAADFCNKVTAEPWIIEPNKKVSETIKDSVWFMNYWENDPTVEGMLNMLDAIHDKANETNAKGIDFPNLDKIKIYFFDLESNGLNENLYLKMNSRGKPLTAFENLKASIEKILPNNLESDETKYYFPENETAQNSFKDKWKFFMDRDWTNAFWNSEKPEETDKNITAFIVRFLSGYYNAFSNSNDENDVKETNNKLKEINSKNNYADFIPFEPIGKSLTSSEAFKRLALAFTTIADADNKIKPSWNETIKTTDYHEYKIIAVVFAYVLFDGNSQAMRVAWNLAENTVSGYDNFIAYCKRIGEIYSYYKKNDDIYQILATKEFKNPSAQLTEEIAKAEQILHGSHRSDGKLWKEIIIEAENYAFFKGAIRFLFQDADGKVTEDSWKQFDEKWGKAQKYFDENGVKEEYKTELTKALVIQCDNWDEQLLNKQIFNPNANTWKWILCSSIWDAPVHKILSIGELDKLNPMSNLSNEGANNYILSILESLPYDVLISNEPNGRFRWYGRLGYYRPHGQRAITFDWGDFHRNQLLNKLVDMGVYIDPEIKVSDSFFWGWNIPFKFQFENQPYDFQWDANGNIYLMENGLYKEKSEDPQEYYCFSADGMTDTNTILKKIMKLIKEISSNE